MGVAERWIVKFTNDSVNELNYAEFGIETDPGTPSTAQHAAQIIAYCSLAGLVMAAGTRIASVSHRAAGATLTSPFPFPNAEYDAIRTANVGSYVNLQDMDSYGVDIGAPGEALAPLGTSIVMSEYSAEGGPSGRGRHYIPFISDVSVSPGGNVANAYRVLLEKYYRGFILGETVSPAVTDVFPLDPVVENALGTTMKPIVVIKCQPVYSNLESRRR